MPKEQRIIEKSDLLAPDVYEKNRRQMRKELVEFKKDRRVHLVLTQLFILNVLRPCSHKYKKCCI